MLVLGLDCHSWFFGDCWPFGPKRVRGPTDTRIDLGPQNPPKSWPLWWTFWVTYYLKIVFPTLFTLDLPFKLLRGPGEVLGRFSFVDYLLWCIMSGTRIFFRNRKILSLAKVITLPNLQNTYNYIACAKFNPDSSKINFEIYLLLQFLR